MNSPLILVKFKQLKLNLILYTILFYAVPMKVLLFLQASPLLDLEFWRGN